MLPSPTPSPSSLHLSNRDSDIDSNQNPWVQNDGLPQGGHDYSNPSTIALSDPARVAGLAVGMALLFFVLTFIGLVIIRYRRQKRTPRPPSSSDAEAKDIESQHSASDTTSWPPHLPFHGPMAGPGENEIFTGRTLAERDGKPLGVHTFVYRGDQTPPAVREFTEMARVEEGRERERERVEWEVQELHHPVQQRYAEQWKREEQRRISDGSTQVGSEDGEGKSSGATLRVTDHEGRVLVEEKLVRRGSAEAGMGMGMGIAGGRKESIAA